MYPIEYAPIIALAFLLTLGAVISFLGRWSQAWLDSHDQRGAIQKPQYLLCLRDLDSDGLRVNGLQKGKLYRLVTKQQDEQIRIELELGQHLICPDAWFEPVRVSSRASDQLSQP